MPVVLAAVLVQLAGAAALVLGLAAIPMAHDLRMPLDVLAGWIGLALLALVCGGLAYQARIFALLVAAIATAALGFILPRGDSAIGVLVHILPHGDVPEQAVMTASIAMFAIGASCIGVLPWAVAYRTWIAGTDTSQPGRTLLGFVAVAKHREEAKNYPVAPKTRRLWLMVTCGAVAIGVVVGFALVEVYGGRTATAHAATLPSTPAHDTATKPSANATATARPAGAASPKRLADALDHALGSSDALALVVDADVVGLGFTADDVAVGSAQVAAMLTRDLTSGAPSPAVVHSTTLDTDGSLAWLTQDVTVDEHHVTLGAVVHEVDGRWTVAALCIAQPLPAKQLAHLAKTHQLGALAALPATPAGAASLQEAADRGLTDRPNVATAALPVVSARALNARIGFTVANAPLKSGGVMRGARARRLGAGQRRLAPGVRAVAGPARVTGRVLQSATAGHALAR